MKDIIECIMRLAPRAGKMNRMAIRAGKMGLSCPLGIRVMSRKERLLCYGVLSRKINPLLTKLVRSKLLDIDLVLFCVFMDEK